jgi:hypothetical protein
MAPLGKAAGGMVFKRMSVARHQPLRGLERRGALRRSLQFHSDIAEAGFD